MSFATKATGHPATLLLVLGDFLHFVREFSRVQVRLASFSRERKGQIGTKL
jgi:hypothetical protein